MLARQLAAIEAPQHGFDPRVAPLVILGLSELNQVRKCDWRRERPLRPKSQNVQSRLSKAFFMF